MWDFFGDVGGLFDMLRLIGSILISLFSSIFGSGLDRFLLEKLFKRGKPAKHKAVDKR